MNQQWTKHFRCPCGRRHFDIPFNQVWYLHGEVCGGCGRDPYEWHEVIGRKVPDAIWWKPWTWFSYHWEES